MSTSRDRVEDTYERQNDQRLDDLHSKIRTLRGVTTDIHDDVERQNLMLDDTSNTFTSFANSLTQSSRRAAHAFGLTSGGVKSWRVAMYVVGAFLSLWIMGKIWWWWSASGETVA
ncbi:hypothetical protein F5879DRAFT_962958 [Lentinula edodes]|uniref:t-SNARE coiled-coil homology domain-containing protein n=1 Tax=Lentinula lateritia TaxID=40482 RepID=A0A9W8ZSQ1_9AGAR|nr:uncharacterized protein C8R40DRAFT_1163966 [Lentinula edodes]KAH7868469.1 hypothetical protein C8R40DRAFT_1163966 [Lentinula edodes]KAJ3882845.1 hypothetical protein F5051DRAFT_393227 [Lentinula edodes]KAJ3885621.1 hypothetical protein GG344DRAFT_70377 [Lentinula edodes]KAJ3902724.1 hypothetical protein F5879DRAFT_962958 [Lentinula edodes]KAJ3915708.1 hypothetical protein F5877DRAFT_48062 [Lentinula edodes]